MGFQNHPIIILFLFLLSSDALLNLNCNPKKLHNVRKISSVPHVGNLPLFSAKKFDFNNDGIVDFDDIMYSPKAIEYLNKLKGLFKPKANSLLPKLKAIFQIVDITVVVALIVLHKRALRLFYSLSPNKTEQNYDNSFLGHIEPSISYALYYLPLLYLIDLGSLLMHYFGFDFHIKANIPHVIESISKCFIFGKFLVGYKNWYFFNHLSRKRAVIPALRENVVRQKTVSEILTVLIWLAMSVLGLEFIQLEFGVTLGSIVTVGGLGFSSAVLALSKTKEDLISGVLLKCRDVFRVGDEISFGEGQKGIVKQFNYLGTVLRRPDNSEVEVPNRLFTTSEVINWSRTPFRKFQTSITIPVENIDRLPVLLHGIEKELKAIDGIESEERMVQVTADGFSGDKLQVTIEVHFRGSEEAELLKLRTAATNVIGNCVAIYCSN